MTTIDLTAVQDNLGDCLRRVATGEAFVIVHDGQPLAELRPPLARRSGESPLSPPRASVLRQRKEYDYPHELGGSD